ncbi:MAG TPA: hypothetical protein VNR60_11375 [Croceibacterium sp.]|nr:hypothetical protein [Croceibacterium sp.]
MRRILVLGFGGCLLAGCGEALTPEEQARLDERDIAMVEKANEGSAPMREVTPEPLLYPDIERHDLYGESCSYAPGTSLGTRVFAREADAFVKIGGEIERFAADPGSRELPMRTRSLYNSRNYALRLRLDAGPDAESEGEAQDGNFEGTVQLFDKYGRVVYEGTGLAQCKRI